MVPFAIAILCYISPLSTIVVGVAILFGSHNNSEKLIGALMIFFGIATTLSIITLVTG